MLRWFCFLAFAALSLSLANLRSHADDPKAVKVLFVVAGHGGEAKAPILEKLFASMDGFAVTRLAALGDLPKIKKGDYDVMLFYGGPAKDEVQERAILTFVEQGGGVVALHHATANQASAWTELIGGRFAGHPAISDVEVIITDAKHPIMAGVDGKFRIFDEAYRHKLADVKREVLAKGKEVAKDNKEIDHSLDLIWTRQVGKGRVVYNALGHGAEAWTNPNWQKLVLQSVLWAAGKPREVKLPAGK